MAPRRRGTYEGLDGAGGGEDLAREGRDLGEVPVGGAFRVQGEERTRVDPDSHQQFCGVDLGRAVLARFLDQKLQRRVVLCEQLGNLGDTSGLGANRGEKVECSRCQFFGTRSTSEIDQAAQRPKFVE